MQNELRINFAAEIKRMAEELKTVIESGSNLAVIWFELQLAKIEAQQRESESIFARLSLKDENSADDVLNTDEAAVLLKMPKATLYWKAGKGEIPHGKVGRRYKFSRKELLALLRSDAADNKK